MIQLLSQSFKYITKASAASTHYSHLIALPAVCATNRLGMLFQCL